MGTLTKKWPTPMICDIIERKCEKILMSQRQSSKHQKIILNIYLLSFFIFIAKYVAKCNRKIATEICRLNLVGIQKITSGPEYLLIKFGEFSYYLKCKINWLPRENTDIKIIFFSFFQFGDMWIWKFMSSWCRAWYTR